MKALVLFLSVLLNISCHTTARWFESDLNEDKNSKLEDSPTQIEEKDLEELRPKILSLQIQYGLLPPKQRMYSLIHNLHCYQDGALQACFLQLMLPKAPFLSQSLSLSRELSVKTLLITTKERSELRKQRQIFASLVCDHLTNTLPPFDRDTIFCRIMNPRQTNEAVILGDDAKQLTDIIARRDRVPESAVSDYKIECESEGAMSCKISQKINNGSSESASWLVLPAKLSNSIIRSFTQSYFQNWAVDKGKNTREMPEVKLLTGTLQCSSLGNVVKSLFRCSILF